MKRLLLVAGLLVTLLQGLFASAQEARTQWAPIEKSLRALLNEGWRIISHSSSDNNLAFSFVLMRESKVVICLFNVPKPNDAASRCRALN
jgi:hypothetical protein